MRMPMNTTCMGFVCSPVLPPPTCGWGPMSYDVDISGTAPQWWWQGPWRLLGVRFDEVVVPELWLTYDVWGVCEWLERWTGGEACGCWSWGDFGFRAAVSTPRVGGMRFICAPDTILKANSAVEYSSGLTNLYCTLFKWNNRNVIKSSNIKQRRTKMYSSIMWKEMNAHVVLSPRF